MVLNMCLGSVAQAPLYSQLCTTVAASCVVACITGSGRNVRVVGNLAEGFTFPEGTRGPHQEARRACADLREGEIILVFTEDEPAAEKLDERIWLDVLFDSKLRSVLPTVIQELLDSSRTPHRAYLAVPAALLEEVPHPPRG